MEKWQLDAAVRQSELALLEILSELGANVQFALRPSDGVAIGFQAFWPQHDAVSTSDLPSFVSASNWVDPDDYDARAHANVIP